MIYVSPKINYIVVHEYISIISNLIGICAINATINDNKEFRKKSSMQAKIDTLKWHW